jgi:hypothetical protein
MEDYNFAKAREAWATPVKIVQYNCLCGRTMEFESEHGVIAPQRTWVGLTNDELTDLFYNTNLGQQSAVAQAIALLKQKNGFAEEKNT